MWIYKFVYICTHKYECIYKHDIYTYIYTYTSRDTYTYMYIYVHIYTYICIRIHIRVYIHTYMQTDDTLYRKNGNVDTGLAATAFNVASSTNSENIGSDLSNTPRSSSGFVSAEQKGGGGWEGCGVGEGGGRGSIFFCPRKHRVSFISTSRLQATTSPEIFTSNVTHTILVCE